MRKFIYIDSETTGFSNNDHVVQIAAVLLDHAGAIERTWSTLIDHGLSHIPMFNIHGITPAMVKGAPTMSAALTTLAELAAGRTPVGHNYAFDRRLINANSERAGHPFRLPEGICTVELARQHMEGPYKLGMLCARLGIPLVNAHDAEADAVAGAVLFKMLHARQNNDGLPVADWLARLTESRAAS